MKHVVSVSWFLAWAFALRRAGKAASSRQSPAMEVLVSPATVGPGTSSSRTPTTIAFGKCRPWHYHDRGGQRNRWVCW